METSKIHCTKEEIEFLLKIQRENCYVSVYNETLNTKIALYALSAPEPMGGGWRNK